MPIQYVVDGQNQIVVATLVGALTVSDYSEATHSIIADPDARPGFGLLLDGRAVDPLPTVDELRQLVNVACEMQLHGIEPFAIVAGTEIQFIVGQLFATLAGAVLNLDTRVFRSYETARDWLRVAVAKRAGNASAPGT